MIHNMFQNQLKANLLSLPKNNTNQLIIGIIVNISKDIIFVDIGTKKNVKFKKSEIFPSYFNPFTKIELGQKIVFLVESFDVYENNYNLNYEKGQTLLKEETVWKEIFDKKYINGRILNQVNGGYSVGIGGLVAFLPKNHLGDIKEKIIGQLKTFSLLKSSKNNNNVIVSRLGAIEAWKRKKVIKIK